jgi:hypothetical protein
MPYFFLEWRYEIPEFQVAKKQRRFNETYRQCCRSEQHAHIRNGASEPWCLSRVILTLDQQRVSRKACVSANRLQGGHRRRTFVHALQSRAVHRCAYPKTSDLNAHSGFLKPLSDLMLPSTSIACLSYQFIWKHRKRSEDCKSMKHSAIFSELFRKSSTNITFTN